MGYSGARGGLEAILAAEDLVRRSRDHAPAPWAETGQITARFRLAVDRVMGEAGLYDEQTAAHAFRQAEGDTLEAAHLVRAHRSALPRLARSEPVNPDEMVVLRRIVPAHRTPEGPQLLGRTSDYTGRLLERLDGPPAATNGNGDGAAHGLETGESQNGNGRLADGNGATRGLGTGDSQRRPRRFSELLREMDLLVDHRPADPTAPRPEPFDVTRRPARPPAPRSAVLASMARAETGALVGLWYRSILGPDGNVHEVTLGEVRHGRLPLRVKHPHTGAPVTVGHFRATETEAIEDLDGADEDRGRFDLGYGLCFGHNERKAIAMANLDIACRRFGRDTPLEQLLLLTVDGLDSGGFLEHLKLPHYVTFRSMVDRKLAVRGTGERPRATDPIGKDCE
ncbi:carbon-phosphorus lyase complex subunit PhnI [Pseudonocardia alaniniphila]|uniref:Carbon-phosphorus lyase complex subunit PhnI n=1 Tax=Pseudonocardia alaniniphila TaxID=75291 RepID=A0ABS9T8E0_9PSEU|nr:carbon-phosphorus lyase complex subunit PhnI [Pseudonocardia alaniniphila]MCH6164804.1 carbon-phosphorus lyase complex subunit PhnI [Pseudonocardia alaniniphila]